jgi:hypothetical protein
MKNYQQTISDAINHVAKGGKIMFRPRCNGKAMKKYFLNPDHTYRECGLMEWGQQLETIDVHVGDTEINGCRVSTVWLGTDHNFWLEGPPLVFETMVFQPRGHDIYLERYTTWEQAEEGHQRAIQWVKDGCKEDEQ